MTVAIRKYCASPFAVQLINFKLFIFNFCYLNLFLIFFKVRMVPSPGFEKSGKWSVVSVNKFSNSEETAEFDAVLVCTGRLSEPFFPSFHDQNSFTGNILHAQSLKSVQEFEDQKVLVVGNGNSGVEASVDISTVAQKVSISLMGVIWVLCPLSELL